MGKCQQITRNISTHEQELNSFFILLDQIALQTTAVVPFFTKRFSLYYHDSNVDQSTIASVHSLDLQTHIKHNMFSASARPLPSSKPKATSSRSPEARRDTEKTEVFFGKDSVRSPAASVPLVSTDFLLGGATLGATLPQGGSPLNPPKERRRSTPPVVESMNVVPPLHLQEGSFQDVAPCPEKMSSLSDPSTSKLPSYPYPSRASLPDVLATLGLDLPPAQDHDSSNGGSFVSAKTSHTDSAENSFKLSGDSQHDSLLPNVLDSFISGSFVSTSEGGGSCSGLSEDVGLFATTSSEKGLFATSSSDWCATPSCEKGLFAATSSSSDKDKGLFATPSCEKGLFGAPPEKTMFSSEPDTTFSMPSSEKGLFATISSEEPEDFFTPELLRGQEACGEHTPPGSTTGVVRNKTPPIHPLVHPLLVGRTKTPPVPPRSTALHGLAPRSAALHERQRPSSSRTTSCNLGLGVSIDEGKALRKRQALPSSMDTRAASSAFAEHRSSTVVVRNAERSAGGRRNLLPGAAAVPHRSCQETGEGGGDSRSSSHLDSYKTGRPDSYKTRGAFRLSGAVPPTSTSSTSEGGDHYFAQRVPSGAAVRGSRRRTSAERNMTTRTMNSTVRETSSRSQNSNKTKIQPTTDASDDASSSHYWTADASSDAWGRSKPSKLLPSKRRLGSASQHSSEDSEESSSPTFQNIRRPMNKRLGDIDQADVDRVLRARSADGMMSPGGFEPRGGMLMAAAAGRSEERGGHGPNFAHQSSNSPGVSLSSGKISPSSAMFPTRPSLDAPFFSHATSSQTAPAVLIGSGPRPRAQLPSARRPGLGASSVRQVGEGNRGASRQVSFSVPGEASFSGGGGTSLHQSSVGVSC